jgi:hypothetical protein
MIISRISLLGMRNFSDKSCTENQNTHFIFKFFNTKIVTFEAMCNNIEYNDVTFSKFFHFTFATLHVPSQAVPCKDTLL